MRTKITADLHGHVTLHGEDEFGTIRTRRFSCPYGGGYVTEYDNETAAARQVCEGLARTGVTLRSPSRDALIEVIRREHRRAKREWREEWR
jgi:hypothetical protein